MRRLMTRAAAYLDQPEVLSPTNLAFHQQIAAASGNTVLLQVLAVLSKPFQDEQRVIPDLHGSWERDPAEHVCILEALERRKRLLDVPGPDASGVSRPVTPPAQPGPCVDPV